MVVVNVLVEPTVDHSLGISTATSTDPIASINVGCSSHTGAPITRFDGFGQLEVNVAIRSTNTTTVILSIYHCSFPLCSLRYFAGL